MNAKRVSFQMSSGRGWMERPTGQYGSRKWGGGDGGLRFGAPLAGGGAEGLGEYAVELGVAAEAGIEGVLEQADFGAGVDAAEKLLQADLVAVGG